MYIYCGNNPAKYVDPSGNSPIIFAEPIIIDEEEAEVIWDFIEPDETDAAYFQAGGLYGPETFAIGYVGRRGGKLVKLAVKEIEKLGIKGTGKWVKANEAMSDLSRAYQRQITGTDMVWLQNGVKFDGFKAGRLIEAKGNYKGFVDKKTGKFYRWFNGRYSLMYQALRQMDAADGAPIDWYFMDETSMNATKELFFDYGIKGINFILEPIK